MRGLVFYAYPCKLHLRVGMLPYTYYSSSMTASDDSHAFARQSRLEMVCLSRVHKPPTTSASVHASVQSYKSCVIVVSPGRTQVDARTGSNTSVDSCRSGGNAPVPCNLPRCPGNSTCTLCSHGARHTAAALLACVDAIGIAPKPFAFASIGRFTYPA